MKALQLIVALVLTCSVLRAQVTTNFNNKDEITSNGKFKKKFKAHPSHTIPSINIQPKKQDIKSETESKPFTFAKAVKTDINVVERAEWVTDSIFAYGKFTIEAKNAKSISANFDQFYLPEGTELYVYNAKGEMITGPVTETENNVNNFWGTWVYKGGFLTIDVKTPIQRKSDLKLHVSSIGYGYVELYVGDYGSSAPCNINVLCPEGSTWGNERNSVALILNSSSEAFCSGALINNVCNLNIPYLLTANHCFDINSNVGQWKFTFQAWSSSCSPSQNASGITFNGSTLKARNSGSDFCLLQMNQSPPANSGIVAAGWSRTGVAVSSGASITHPRGDVMKIALYNTTITQQTIYGSSDWKVAWSAGTVEEVSSGAPLFDSNRRIIGQVHSGNPALVCTANDYANFGRFDISWDGGGTDATGLKHWLDPNNTNATAIDARGVGISGPDVVCSTSQFLFAGQTVNWSSSNTSALSINASTGIATRIGSYNGSVTITATISGSCGTSTFTRNVTVGTPVPTGISGPGYNLCRVRGNPHEEGTYYVASPKPGITYQWELLKNTGQIVNLSIGTSVTILASAPQFTAGTHTLRVKASSCAQVSTWYSSTIIITASCSSLLLKTFPNPTTSELYINVSEDSPDKTSEFLTEEVKIELFNSEQLQVFEHRTSRKHIVIQTKNIPNGIYYLNFYCREGVIQRKIIVKN